MSSALSKKLARKFKKITRIRKTQQNQRSRIPDAIRTAARNTDDIYEIAFTLNVSVEFLRESIDWYMARGLWSQETLPDEMGEGTSAPDSALD